MAANLPPLKLRQCRNVEIFTTAGFSQGEYDRAALEKIVENFYLLGPYRLALLRPPAGIGHADAQEFLKAMLAADPRLAPWLTAATLDGDDAPAAGWITAIRTVPDEDDPNETKLLADIDEIPAPIADLIDSRSFRRVSSEIYDDFKDGDGKAYGYALRRVALLGWQPPVNKGMADLPATVAKFGEPTRRRMRAIQRTAANPGTYLCYSEYRPMDKTQMLAGLKAKGLTLSEATVATMDDAIIGALYKKYSESPVPVPAPAPAPQPTPVVKMEEPATRDQMIAEMQAAGQDAAQLAQLDDATLATMYQEWKSQAATANPGGAALAEIKKYGETVKVLATTLAAEVAKAKNLNVEAAAEVAKIKKYAEETARTQKDAKIANLRLDLVGANGTGVAYCTPAEFDALHRDTLQRLDDSTVQKFGEPGKEVSETPFSNYVRKIKSLPPKKVFGEKMPDPTGDPADRLGSEKNKVRVYAEQNESAVKAFGYTPDTYVQRFEEAAKKIPNLTAETFIGKA